LILSDKDALFAYRSDAETNKYQGWIPKGREEVEAFIGRIPHQINRPETWFQLAIVEKETQQLIGDVGIHFMDKANLQAEVGCTIDKRYQNKGYATEALVRVLDYLFGELQKHRVTASIDPEN